MSLTSVVAPSTSPENVAALVGERLSLSALHQLCGTLGGYSFVKVVVDRELRTIHFLNDARHSFHAIYIGEEILGVPEARVRAEIDGYNERFYHAPDRRFLLGILALHTRQEKKILSLETVEVDTMPAALIREFHAFVAEYVDPALPLLFKPANQLQERLVREIPAAELPRVFAHELFSTAPFVALNPGTTTGRLRAFRTEAEYRAATATGGLAWSDIIVMDRVPDDIPRLSGIVNARHTTPLSHTNVLATGWQIPNAVQLGALAEIERRGLDGKWVEYTVDAQASSLTLREVDEPADAAPPSWYAQRVTLEEPESDHSPIVNLARLRAADRYRYGTKAANLGELHHVLACGSQRLLGFYQVPRPPRENLLPHLAQLLGIPAGASVADLSDAARRLLDERIRVPRGIALPFSLQRRFLESSPRIQQAIGKLKMALELDAREIEPLCVELQSLIRSARMPGALAGEIDSALVSQLAGVRAFVVRSSSNAEDLAGFSAAGIYESINHVTTAERIFASVKEVWASLVSVRSVRLRHQAGISLDECYMGVVIQEQVAADFGGVLVTTNPMNRADFRTVYVNVSPKVTDVVDGSTLPMQYLYSTVEGGGRTVSLGDAAADLDERAHEQLQRLAVAGRLLQAHFSPDYTFDSPVDVEWLADRDHVHIVQLRPYSA
ncbi:PEP/pyruvate-binding domain-containing protein [Amycolatopsis sp. WQ 127309]|uniref:PEP/pyruvate-binding domain-containing protein n=1 Tax=Amycolatopsis sp. WQ 127309 TaxID=2932773 RepID=UPI001FF51814|nr:PEP/pyruvate-binding domain-containing protein [Amycolatopsis sp. WQ 127309]UOZ11285.1 phosphoenolpyruvate synthase [Amycolatopsis sp. WQ 127309]